MSPPNRNARKTIKTFKFTGPRPCPSHFPKQSIHPFSVPRPFLHLFLPPQLCPTPDSCRNLQQALPSWLDRKTRIPPGFLPSHASYPSCRHSGTWGNEVRRETSSWRLLSCRTSSRCRSFPDPFQVNCRPPVPSSYLCCGPGNGVMGAIHARLLWRWGRDLILPVVFWVFVPFLPWLY
jgi:hypothetical protein